MKKLILAGAVVLSLSSCVTIDYVGKTFAPNPTVQMYFDRGDIPQDYEVMGMLTAEAPEIVNSRKVQQRIMERAAYEGADAVLFEYLDKKISGANTNTGYDRWGEFSSTTTTEDKIVQAKFIKFRTS